MYLIKYVLVHKLKVIKILEALPQKHKKTVKMKRTF